MVNLTYTGINMGGKKSKAPKPDYKTMARNYATWQHEDTQWRESRIKEAANIHNREMSRDKARYAASGGSKDKIAEIEAEHKRKFEETTAGIEKQYTEKQQTLRSGFTRGELLKRFRDVRHGEITDKYRSMENIAERDVFLKNVGATATDRGLWHDSDSPYRRNYRDQQIVFGKDSKVFSDEEFEKWVAGYGEFKPSAGKVEEKPEGIKTRRGEKPRTPLQTSQLEENPWV